ETVRCTFTNTKDGRLIVEKQTLPDGDPASFAFTTTATGAGTFSLSDGGTESRDVAPGSYTATESVKAGWELTGLSCSDQNSTTDKANRKATFDISPGETVTCTFTNTKDGRLIVEKQTLPDGDPTQFDFSTSAPGSAAFKLSDGQTEARDVKPGTYTATEAAASGFRLDQVSCSDADSTGDKPARTATFRIAPGETVTCTFLNRTITSKAIVVKAGNTYA
ncbi:MAG: prealbumin-like fold domain-containing protein, partial [Solirubrobacteraceae bacterium]